MSSGYVGIDKDYFVSVKEVLNITAETGAWETQIRIRKLPPVDVVEVKHGRWEKSYLEESCGTDENHNTIFRNIPCVKCDKCGEKRRSKEKYCPNCGAKMDGEE